MQNELLKHGFLQKKAGKNIIFEKEEALYDNELGGVIDHKHIILKKNGKFYLSKVHKRNLISSYLHFLNIFNYDDKSEHGFVYLIKYNSVYKIGMTKDLKTRITFFKNTLPGKVELVSFITSLYYKEIEKYLHEVFKDRLFTEYDREWFKLDEECLFFFKKVKTVVEH